MAIYISKSFRKLASGKKLVYYVLRSNVWDYKEKRQRTKYVAYIGVEPSLPLDRARQLAKRLKIELSALKRVKGLKILSERDQS